jgi:ribosomal protein L29
MSKKNTNNSNLSVDEMVVRASELEKEIFVLRNELAVNRKLEKPHLIKVKRHERARLLTLITQNRSNVQ